MYWRMLAHVQIMRFLHFALEYKILDWKPRYILFQYYLGVFLRNPQPRLDRTCGRNQTTPDSNLAVEPIPALKRRPIIGTAFTCKYCQIVFNNYIYENKMRKNKIGV